MARYFQTAPSLPDDAACRTFEIPNSLEWLGIFNALYPLLINPYNWEQVNDTDMTVEESITIVKGIWSLYWESTGLCGDTGNCLQPSGSRVLRLSSSGHVEQLTGDEWIAPTDDYEIPPTPAREEPTTAERKCAAAANAAFVLKETYEQVTDLITETTTVAELAVYFATTVTIALAPAFGFIAPAFIFLLEAAAYAFIEIAQYMGADVWSVEFNDVLLCVLLDCASDDDDVVTFDYQCVTDALAKNTNIFSVLGEAELLLYGQLCFMLSIIGVDGLNIAGATTGVAEPNCDECLTWCYVWDIEEDGLGDWTVALGAQGTPYVYLTRTFAATEVTYIQNEFSNNGVGTGGSSAASIYKSDTLTTPNRIAILAPVNSLLFTDWHGVETMTSVGIGVNNDGNGAGVWSIRRVTMAGNGANPFGENNCIV